MFLLLVSVSILNTDYGNDSLGILSIEKKIVRWIRIYVKEA